MRGEAAGGEGRVVTQRTVGTERAAQGKAQPRVLQLTVRWDTALRQVSLVLCGTGSWRQLLWIPSSSGHSVILSLSTEAQGGSEVEVQPSVCTAQSSANLVRDWES